MVNNSTYHQTYGATCRKILQKSIKLLFQEEQIHKLKLGNHEKHLKMIFILLENYEEVEKTILSHEELWNLIKIENKFSKFIKDYPEAIQINMISSLIKTENKSTHDLECIIDLYHLMNPKVRQTLNPLIVKEYHKMRDITGKHKLSSEVLQIESLSFDQTLKHISDSTEPSELISWLILAQKIL